VLDKAFTFLVQRADMKVTKPKAKAKTRTVTYLPELTYHRLCKFARRQKMTVSEVAERLLTLSLEKEREDA
jgi:hypothetical protein